MVSPAGRSTTRGGLQSLGRGTSSTVESWEGELKSSGRV